MAEYAVIIKAYDPGTASEVTLYFSTNGYTSGPADAPANQYYEPLLENPGVFTFQMYSNGKLSGPASTGYGAIILINNIGQLDYLIDYGLDGREIIAAEITPNGLAPFLIGTMEQPLPSLDQVSIRIRDRKAELDVPFQPTKYLGNNTLPAGLEGVEDIKGKPKPRLYGVRYNVTPVLVNTSRLIYQMSDIALNDIPNVYDRGVALSKGTDYTDQTDMETNAPAAGTYRAWLAGGCFRLGSSPAGQVTADGVQGAAAANRTKAQIIKQIVQIPIAASDCIEQGFIDLDKANAAEVGIYISTETTYAAVLDELCSPDAWYGFENMGKFCIRRLELPGTTAITTIDDSKILGMERLATNDTGRGVPVWQVNLNYAKNDTVQTSDLAAGVTDARRQWLNQQYRTVTAPDATVKTAHLLASELNVNTPMVDAAAAKTEAERLQVLFGTRRDYLKVTVPRTQLLYDVAGYWDNEAISDLSVRRTKTATVVHGNFLYVIGGYLSAPTASVIRLDLNNPTGAWDDAGVTDLPATRYQHSAHVHNGYLYVVGGYNKSSVIRLDLSNPTGVWDDAGVTDMPREANLHASCIYNDHLYVFGGFTSGGSAPTASVIRLDLSNPTGAWDDAGVTDLPATRTMHNADVYENYVYISGGKTGVTALNSVIRLDLSNPTGVWDDAGVTDLPATRFNQGGKTSCIYAPYLYMIGGSVDGETSSSSVVRLNLSRPNSSWDDAGISDLPTIRSLHSVVMSSSSIYVIGGQSGTATENTYIFRHNDNPNDLAHIWSRNKVVKLATNRFNYNSSKYMRIVGAEVNLAEDTITLYVWG